MNKLEALNNPKYSLTPEKMGELVGGAICCEASGANAYSSNCSCDVITHYTGEDMPVNSQGKPVSTTYTPLYGKGDWTLQSELIAERGGFCS